MAEQMKRPGMFIVSPESLEDRDYYHDPEEVDAYITALETRCAELESTDREQAHRRRRKRYMEMRRRLTRLRNRRAEQAKTITRLRKVLTEIAKKRGRFDMDPLIHASNAVDDMAALAIIALAEGEKYGPYKIDEPAE